MAIVLKLFSSLFILFLMNIFPALELITEEIVE